MTDNNEGVGLQWALKQLNKKYLGSVQSTGTPQEQLHNETCDPRRDDWKKGEKVRILGGKDVWTVYEDETDDDVCLVNDAGVVITCDWARIRAVNQPQPRVVATIHYSGKQGETETLPTKEKMGQFTCGRAECNEGSYQ